MIQPTAKTVCVPARFSSLPQLLAMLSTHAVAPEHVPSLLRAQLAVEELFVNSIHHGYGQETDHPVWLTVQHGDTVLRVVYTDQAQAFNPLSPDIAMSDDAGDDIEAHKTGQRIGERIGGVGLRLIVNLARCGHYTREEGRNVTQLEFALTHGSGFKALLPDHPRPNGLPGDGPRA